MSLLERLLHIEAECRAVLTRYGAVDVLVQPMGVADRYEIAFILPAGDQ